MNRNNDNAPDPRSDSPPVAGLFRQMLGHLRVSIIATIVLTIICCGVYPAIVWGLAQTLFHRQATGSLIKRDGTPTAVDSEAIGSSLLGQSFAATKYFHPRPSAAGAGYDATSSGGSNLGPLSAKFLNGTTKPAAPVAPATQPTVAVDFDGVKLRTLLYAQENGIGIAESSPPLKSFMDDKGNYDQVKLIQAFNDADHALTFRTAAPIPPDAVTASASGLDPHVSIENARIQAQRVADARKLSLDRVKALIEENTEGPDWGIFGDPGVNVLKLNIALDNLSPQ